MNKIKILVVRTAESHYQAKGSVCYFSCVIQLRVPLSKPLISMFFFLSSSLLNIQVDSHCNLHSLSKMINLNSDCSNDICRSEIKRRHNKVWNQTSCKLTSFLPSSFKTHFRLTSAFSERCRIAKSLRTVRR